MVTTLFLLRHGVVETDGARHYYGSTDVPLLREGVRQMMRARDFISHHLAHRDFPTNRACMKETDHTQETCIGVGTMNTGPEKRSGLAAVYCSDLRRAVRSAEIIGARYELDPIRVPALRERDFGIWEGMTFNGIKDKHPLEFEAWMTNPLEHRPTGGENTMEVGRRVAAAIEEIVRRHPGDAVAVVAHGGVNRVFLCQVMKIPLENLFTIEQDHGSVNIIEFGDGYTLVKLMNGRAYG